ncbi:hypothetical protein PT274_03805 [Leuconostocaceae bacterium ESL0958]|nr:hypothetical protein [Leuconostocaceae bacterium ESL0958]
MKDKNINYMALLGMIFSNILLIMTIGLVIIGLTLTAIITDISMIFSSVLFILFVSLKEQSFDWTTLLITIAISVVGLLLILPLRKVLKFLLEYLKRYCKYTMKSIFY